MWLRLFLYFSPLRGMFETSNQSQLVQRRSKLQETNRGAFSDKWTDFDFCLLSESGKCELFQISNQSKLETLRVKLPMFIIFGI